MLHHTIFNRTKKFQQITALGVVLAVVGIGSYLLLGSHATSPYSSVTANGGTVNNATTKSCSGASTSTCVVFNGGSSSSTGSPWIGLNGYTGWGGTYNSPYGGTTSYQSLFYSDGFRWARLDESGGGCSSSDEAEETEQAGINVMLIIPETPSAADSCMAAHAGDGSKVIFEFGNEPFYNGVPVATYASEYQQAYDYKHCIAMSGVTLPSPCTPITQPLVFMTTGNPGSVTGSNPNLLWLDAAVDAVPNLQIDAISTHTYDEADEDLNDTSNGVVALADEHADAVAIKEGSTNPFTNTPWYVTEYGFTLCDPQGSSCPTTSSTANAWYVPSYCEQEKQLILGYNAMMAYGDGTSGTWLKGIMWYETHDNGVPIGDFGLVTDSPSSSGNTSTQDNAGETIGHGATGSSIILRPAYTALKGYITSNYETPISCSD